MDLYVIIVLCISIGYLYYENIFKKHFGRTRGFEKISLNQWMKDGGDSMSYNSIILPSRKTSGSAGYDISSTLDLVLEPGDEAVIPLGWKVYMPEKEFLMVVPRSGLGFKFYMRLANTIGVIDSDYYNNETNEGHCFAKIRNEGDKRIVIMKKDAIAQCIFMDYKITDDDNQKSKRKGGFGSTG